MNFVIRHRNLFSLNAMVHEMVNRNNQRTGRRHRIDEKLVSKMVR